MSENIWGWKFSFISLVLIVAGFLFLVLVGPKQEEVINDEMDHFEEVDSTKSNE